MQNKNNIDMLNGAILPRLIAYSLPIMLSGILQLLYNAADVIVVGRFAGKESLSAVGSTGSLINLQINLILGLAVGTRVVIAQYYGAKDRDAVSQASGTSVFIALVCGVALAAFGSGFAGAFMSLMKSPADVIGLSTLYLRIYFLGMPAVLIVNFGTSILGAAGDTKRPMYIMLGSGLINVGLNLFFVIVFKMDVAGVALATIISQYASAMLILRLLVKTDDAYKITAKNLKIYPDKLKKILVIGIPAGVQGTIFSISNVIIQTSVNMFGSTVIAGNSAAANAEGFVYTSMNAIYQSTLTFTGQNLGAHKWQRIGKIYKNGIFLVTAIGLLLGSLMYIFSGQVISIYTTDPSVIPWGQLRILWICVPYFLCGIMEVNVGSLRGMGRSVTPMIVSILGVCGVRIVWIYVVKALGIVTASRPDTVKWIYFSYTISWAATSLVHMCCVFYVKKKVSKQQQSVATQ